MALQADSFKEGPKSMLTRASGWAKTRESLRKTWKEMEDRLAQNGEPGNISSIDPDDAEMSMG